MKKTDYVVFTPLFANSLDAYVPELWAEESLIVLEQNIIAAALVHRDFEDEIKMYGDTVHTRRPGKFVGKRKEHSAAVTVQDAVATNVEVKLDQHLHTSFFISDGEESKGFKNLLATYLEPAMQAIARQVDEIVISQQYQFLANSVGQLGTPVTKSTAVALNTKMDTQLMPQMDRRCLVTPSTKGDLLNVSEFTDAEKIADGGLSVRNGSIGRYIGVDYVMSQLMPSVTVGQTILTKAINNAAGYPAGTTTMTIDGTGTPVPGQWVSINGVPYRATTGTIITTLVIEDGLREAVADDDVVTVKVGGLVNLTAGYALNYGGTIVVDNFAGANVMQRGQLASFGVSTGRYGVTSGVTTTAIDLDRRLEAAQANDIVVGIAPDGNYNFGFHRNAIALVTRPLALPATNMASAAVATADSLSVRVVITYDGTNQGHLVTVDLLAGVKVLDTDLGVCMFG